MLTIQQVNSAIMLQTWTDVELRSMIDAVKWNRTQLQKQVKRSLTVGDTVSFASSKMGCAVTGRVRKIAIKFVTVDTGQTLWRVPANMLSKINEPEFA